MDHPYRDFGSLVGQLLLGQTTGFPRAGEMARQVKGEDSSTGLGGCALSRGATDPSASSVVRSGQGLRQLVGGEVHPVQRIRAVHREMQRGTTAIPCAAATPGGR